MIEVAPYAWFARVYDRPDDDAGDGGSVKAGLVELLDGAIAPRGRVLELACGTGDNLVALAARGHRPEGLDRSPEMLARARVRPELAVVPLVEAAMQAWTPTGGYDGILCASFSLTYLSTPAELAAVVATVRRALVPGGAFVFDMLTPAAVAPYFGSADEAHTWDDLTLAVASCVVDSSTQRFEVVFRFEETATGVLAIERHVGRAVEIAELEAVLAAAGFAGWTIDPEPLVRDGVARGALVRVIATA